MEALEPKHLPLIAACPTPTSSSICECEDGSTSDSRPRSQCLPRLDAKSLYRPSVECAVGRQSPQGAEHLPAMQTQSDATSSGMDPIKPCIGSSSRSSSLSSRASMGLDDDQAPPTPFSTPTTRSSLARRRSDPTPCVTPLIEGTLARRRSSVAWVEIADCGVKMKHMLEEAFFPSHIEEPERRLKERLAELKSRRESLRSVPCEDAYQVVCDFRKQLQRRRSSHNAELGFRPTAPDGPPPARPSRAHIALTKAET